MAPILFDSFVNGIGNRAITKTWDINEAFQPGDIVPWHFLPGIVVASFFASLTGTLLTVELLHRKQLGKSVMSRYALTSYIIGD